MKAMVYKAVEVEIKPGDKVTIESKSDDGNTSLDSTMVTKVVETFAGVYVVFANNTWRPLSSYGVSWWKEDDYVNN